MSGKGLKKKIEYLHSSFVFTKKCAVYCTTYALFLPSDKRITLGFFVNTEHKVWNSNHKKQTLYIGIKHHNDASNDAFELSQSSRNQIIRLHIKPKTPLSKNKKFIQR